MIARTIQSLLNWRQRPPPQSVVVEVPATAENFDETGYLAANPDVADNVRANGWKNGRAHFDSIGHKEQRRLRLLQGVDDIRREKIARLEPLLKREMEHTRRGLKYDFLSSNLRKTANIVNTTLVSSNPYDHFVLNLINEFSDGLVLDCGAGRRPIYYANVVNYEIVDYDTTDVIGVGEALPFKDESFDAVVSLAVLEHVRDPFACAGEIVRVLKPGGKLLCCVPFLQPLHGYPHHYYNMSPQGLKALFDRELTVDDHQVIDSGLPIWALTWIVQSWAAGLKGADKEKFLAMSLRDLLQQPPVFLSEPWVRNLPTEKNFELACGTVLFAHKPR